MFSLNSECWIHAMGSYYRGTVTKVTDKRIQVTYTSGAGKTRQKWHSLDEATQQYYDSKYNRIFPLVHGSQPKRAGARVKGGGLFSVCPVCRDYACETKSKECGK